MLQEFESNNRVLNFYSFCIELFVDNVEQSIVDLYKPLITKDLFMSCTTMKSLEKLHGEKKTTVSSNFHCVVAMEFSILYFYTTKFEENFDGNLCWKQTNPSVLSTKESQSTKLFGINAKFDYLIK